jgi:MFS family permease
MVSAPSRLGVFRHRSFAAFWLAGFCSNVGTWLHVIASSILVFSWTQSTGALGLLGFASYLPLLLFTLPAGVLTDRVDRRLVVTVSHLGGCIAAGSLAVLIHSGVESVEAVAVCGFAVYTAYAIAKPATSSIFPGLVPRAEIPSATAMNSLSFVLGQFAGPLLASVCIAFGAPALAFGLNAASYLGVIAVVAALPPTADEALLDRSASPMAQIRGGLSYAAREPLTRSLLVVLAVSAPLPEVMRLMSPAIAVRAGGDEAIAGVVAAGIGIGSAVGLSVAARLYRASRLRAVIAAGLAVLAIGSVLLAAVPLVAVAVVAAVIVGLGNGLTFASLTAAIQSTVPDQLRGRVMSIHTLLHLGTRPVFTPIAGWLAAVVGIGGATVIFVLLLPIGFAALRRGTGQQPQAVARRAIGRKADP